MHVDFLRKAAHNLYFFFNCSMPVIISVILQVNLQLGSRKLLGSQSVMWSHKFSAKDVQRFFQKALMVFLILNEQKNLLALAQSVRGGLSQFT